MEEEDYTLNASTIKRSPILTYMIIGYSVLVYLLLVLPLPADVQASLRDVLLPNTYQLLTSHFWGFFTSNFVHLELWHIGFNLMWIWALVRRLELFGHRGLLLALILVTGIASSCGQLAVSDSTGIGLSGIVYGLFGFMLIRHRVFGDREYAMDRNTQVILIAWLFGCILLTEFDVLAIANGGHFGGFLAGVAIGLAGKVWSGKTALTAALVSALMISSLFWSPWTVAMLVRDAYHYHVEDNYPEAIKTYEAILDRNPENEFAKVNREVMVVRQLQDSAYKAHADEEYALAKRLYLDILERDSENEWAKENLDLIRLPELKMAAYEAHVAGRFEEARTRYEEVIALDPGDAWAQGNLFMIRDSVASASIVKQEGRERVDAANKLFLESIQKKED